MGGHRPLIGGKSEILLAHDLPSNLILRTLRHEIGHHAHGKSEARAESYQERRTGRLEENPIRHTSQGWYWGKPMSKNPKKYHLVATFVSKSGSHKLYSVKVDDEGNFSCNCPAWIFKKGRVRTCPHLRQIGRNPSIEVKIVQTSVRGWEIQDLSGQRNWGGFVSIKQARDEAKHLGFKVVRIEKWPKLEWESNPELSKLPVGSTFWRFGRQFQVSGAPKPWGKDVLIPVRSLPDGVGTLPGSIPVHRRRLRSFLDNPSRRRRM